MLLSHLTSLVLAVSLGTTPPVTSRADSTIAQDTASLPLTVDALAHMRMFWERFQKEPDSISTIPEDYQESLHLSVDTGPAKGQELDIPGAVNIKAMAATFPSVAADLKDAHLTAVQWERYRQSLCTALPAMRLARLAAVDTSITARNVAFLRAHGRELNMLLATGMWILPWATPVGQPAPQLLPHRWLNAPADTQTTFGDGHVYVLFYTAEWCSACQAVYPVLDSLLTTFAAKGLRVVYATVAIEDDGTVFKESFPEQQQRFTKYFVGKHKVTSPVAIYENANHFAASGYFTGSSIGLPQVFVINRAGLLQDALSGGDLQQLSTDVAKLVESPLPAKH